MPYISLQPGGEATDHPAYRYLIIQAWNLYGPTFTAQYGMKLVLDINGTAVTLVSRKKVGSVPITGGSVGIYEFDISGIIQEFLTEDLRPFGDDGAAAEDNGRAIVTGDLYDMYTDTDGIVQVDESSETPITEFHAHNTVRQHEEERSEYHFTMGPYSYEYTNPELTSFLTKKPNHSKVCMEDSEFLSFLVPDTEPNPVQHVLVRTYDAADTQLRAGLYELPTFDSDERRWSFGTGPVNLNANTWSYAWPAIGMGETFIDSDAAYYTVEIGTALLISIPMVGWVILSWVPTASKTFYLECPCCSSRERFYFLNSAGSIDLFAFNRINETTLSAKSSAYQKTTTTPHEIDKGGDQRLNTIRPLSRKYISLYEETDREWLEEFIGASKMWRWNGSHYVPVKIKDDTFKMDPQAEGGILIEFEIANANDNFSQRN